MVANTFENLSFELGGPGDDPAEPDGWSSAVVLVGTDVAAWDFSPSVKPWEDFETGWSAVLPNVLLSREQFFNLVDGSTIQVSVNGGAAQVVTFNAIDFGSISLATAAEVAAVITAALAGASASAVDGRVRLEGAAVTDTVEIVGPVTDANDVLGFPYVRTEPRVLVSAQEPFTLRDGDTLSLEAAGALVTVQFVAGDFTDIANASASEVKTVIDAAIGGSVTTDTQLGRLVLSTNPFGSPLYVVGSPGESTANEVLDFPRVLDAFTVDTIDALPATFSGGPVELFESQYAGIAARAYTGNKAPFAVSNGDTLQVEVDLQPAQVVVFAGIAVGGAATAEEIASNLSAQLTTPSATATAIGETEVCLLSDFVGPSSGIRVTGGTAQAALSFPTGAFIVAGNETYLDVLPSVTAAVWNTAPDDGPVENFEREWGSNESFVWVLTLDTVVITDVNEDDVFTLTTGTRVYPYTVGALDTPTSVATNLAALVNGDGQAVVSAVAVGGVITLTRLDTRTKLDPLTLVVTSGDGAGAIGTELTSASIDAALFDAALVPVEEFEADWFLPAYTWELTGEVFRVLTAVAGETYVLEYGPDFDRREATYTALAVDDEDAIATALRAQLLADPDVGVGPVDSPGGIPIVPVGNFQLNPKFTDDNGRTQWEFNSTSGLIDAALFSDPGGTDPEEDFEAVFDEQLIGTFPGADPQPAGTYEFTLNGVLIQHVSPGGETAAAIAASLAGKVNTSSIRFDAEAQELTGQLRIRSQACPRVELGVELAASPGDALVIEPVDPTEYFTNLARMCSI